MSDRLCVLETDGLQLFRDGETGTWRLFVERGGLPENVDLSLSQLETLASNLGYILANIHHDPTTFNAELRKTWQDTDA